MTQEERKRGVLVIVVDDDPGMCKILARRLQDGGLEHVIAETFDEVCVRIKEAAATSQEVFLLTDGQLDSQKTGLDVIEYATNVLAQNLKGWRIITGNPKLFRGRVPDDQVIDKIRLVDVFSALILMIQAEES